MRRKRLVTGISTFGLALLASFEIARGYLETLGLKEEAAVRIEVGSAVVLVIAIQALIFHLSSAQAEEYTGAFDSQTERLRMISEAVGGVDARLDRMQAVVGRLDVLSREEVYTELVHAAEKAEARVYNTYLGITPPNETSPVEKRDYFRDLAQLARRKDNVEFRRVVLMTSANAPWIRKLVTEYEGLANVSMAIYCKPHSALLPLSLQFFDADKVFIMHAKRPPWQPRDIVIADPTVVTLLDDYYEELWALSHVVLDSGRTDHEKLNSALHS